MKKLLLITVLLLAGFSGYSQLADTLDNPILREPDLQLEKSAKAEWPNPNRAILFSIIPGGGQIYNKKLWKVPIVYAAVGIGVGVSYYNRSIYIRLRDALNLSRQGMEHEFSYLGWGTTTLKIRRDTYNKYMQQAYLGTLVVYLLQATEAFVDAHLMTFDMDEDLSMQVLPKSDFIPFLNQPTVGISLSIPISR